MLALTACVKNEFRISFELPAATDRTYTLTYYASDSRQGRMVEQVANVQKGRAEVELPMVLPSIVYVSAGNDRLPGAVFYAERGDHISVKGNDPSPLRWTITGNKLTDALTEWRLANAGLIAAAGHTDTAAAERLNKAVEKYVAANAESPVSTLLLLIYFDRGADEALFLKCFRMLKGEAAKEKWKELVSRVDIISEIPADDSLPVDIVLNTVATGCDTIVPGRVPLLLSFTRNGLPDHKENIKFLRELSREFPDSSRRVIADISFEGDSVARWYPVRSDSLSNVVRAWMPLAVSDSLAAAMRVGGLPYLIVADSRGKVIYRGGDMKTAGEAFRRALRKDKTATAK